MFLGAGEIVVVLAVALMVLGPKKMPEVARNLARFVAQLRRMADDVRSQVDDALQEPPKTLPSPPPKGEVIDADASAQAPLTLNEPDSSEKSAADVGGSVSDDGPPRARPPEAQ